MGQGRARSPAMFLPIGRPTLRPAGPAGLSAKTPLCRLLVEFWRNMVQQRVRNWDFIGATALAFATAITLGRRDR